MFSTHSALIKRQSCDTVKKGQGKHRAIPKTPIVKNNKHYHNNNKTNNINIITPLQNITTTDNNNNDNNDDDNVSLELFGDGKEEKYETLKDNNNNDNKKKIPKKKEGRPPLSIIHTMSSSESWDDDMSSCGGSSIHSGISDYDNDSVYEEEEEENYEKTKKKKKKAVTIIIPKEEDDESSLGTNDSSLKSYGESCSWNLKLASVDELSVQSIISSLLQTTTTTGGPPLCSSSLLVETSSTQKPRSRILGLPPGNVNDHYNNIDDYSHGAASQNSCSSSRYSTTSSRRSRRSKRSTADTNNSNNEEEEDAPALAMVISDLQVVRLVRILTTRNSQKNMAGIPLRYRKGNALAIRISDIFTFPISEEEGTSNTDWLWRPLLDGLLKGGSEACNVYIGPPQQNNDDEYKKMPLLMWLCQWKKLKALYSWKGRANVISLVLGAGADPNIHWKLQQQTNGKFLLELENTTPIFSAVQYGCIDTIKTLVKFGADVTNVRDVMGRSCLWYALERHQQKMIRYLLQQHTLDANERFPTTTKASAKTEEEQKEDPSYMTGMDYLFAAQLSLSLFYHTNKKTSTKTLAVASSVSASIDHPYSWHLLGPNIVLWKATTVFPRNTTSLVIL